MVIRVVKMLNYKSLLMTARYYYRWFRLFLLLIEGMILATLCGAAFSPYKTYQMPVIQFWHRRFCRLLGLDVRVYGEVPALKALWVSNHISWLDILVLGGKFPVYFLSKAEVASWPLIGWLAKIAGTLFIKRGSGDSRQVSDQLAQHLQLGRNVLFFPEGTTTDGQTVKRFYHKLFASVAGTNDWIQPVLVCYRDQQGGLHPHAPFIGDDEFLSHAQSILRCSQIPVDVYVLPAEQVNYRDARVLAKDMEILMSLSLSQLQSGQLLANKTIKKS
jgi:1-acyl-sn-glycerol-3-phosphate acyltransferase